MNIYDRDRDLLRGFRYVVRDQEVRNPSHNTSEWVQGMSQPFTIKFKKVNTYLLSGLHRMGRVLSSSRRC